MRSVWIRLLFLGVALCSVVLQVAPADAQPAAVPPSMYNGSTDKRIIASQLRLADEWGRKALAGLQAAPRDASVPLDEDVIKAARATYGLIRAARHGLGTAIENQKYPDPMDQLSYKRLDSAWNLSRYPVDASSWAGIPREEYLDESVQKLSRALQLVGQALVLLP